MNSSESSVIVLDSDDEEDQSVRHPKKTAEIKSNVSKTTGHSNPSNLQSVRNSITLTNSSTLQHAKPKSATVSMLSSTKNSNSVSIIPLNNTQNQKSGSNINSQISKNPQVAKISPKNSPRNSPILKTVPNSGSIASGGVGSIVQRKSPNSVGSLTSNKGTIILDNTRNINNNDIKTIDGIISKSAVNLQQKFKIQNAPPQSILKRKFDNHSEVNDLRISNATNQKGTKRIKPTLISSAVSHKWNQFSSTITIDDDDDDDDQDDDDFFDSTLKTKQSKKLGKSRSNSITSSSAPSPSLSASSTATSPQSQSSPATPSPSIKDVNRRSDTPKLSVNNSGDRNPKENHLKQASFQSDKNNKDEMITEKSIKDIDETSDSPIPNGNITSDGKVIEKQKNEIIPAFNKLIEACQQADNSSDMNLLIEKKLLKYYHSIHPDYITSKSFKKTVENITNEILETPNLVYIKLKTIIEELKTRKNSKVVVVSNDGQTSTGNDEVDEQVRKLNKGLRKLKHIIAKLEEEEVEWESDFNSSYLKVERFKKRACEIYEKICDLTGESKHAQRTVRKPIIFDHTAYPKINKAIEQFVNKTRTFPDYYDILTILQHCNKNYKLELTSEELKRIAQDAFVKVGKLLQNRRKTDLYETLSHFTEKNKDPALEDQDLNAKLNENKKHYGKINALIQKYAREQDTMQTEKLKAKEEIRKTNLKNDSLEEDSDNNNINKTATDNLPNHKQDHQEKLKDDCVKTPKITEEMRNTPSCSSSSRSNIIQDKTENNKKNGDNNDDSNSTKINNNNCNSNNNIKKNIESTNKIINVNQTENKITKNLVSETSNVNNLNKTTFKIVNVTSLCEKTEKKSKLSPLEKDNVVSTTKLFNIKSIVPSSLNVSNTVNKTKVSEVHEIILSDDEV